MRTFKRFFRDTKKYLGYTIDATRAQLKAEVANSYLNWIWWILEPICFMLIFYLIFVVFFNLREEHAICFIMLGISMWDFFSHMMNNSVSIMRTNKSIVSKVYLPKHILLLVRVGVNGFKMLISFAIVVVMMIIDGVSISWTIFMVIPLVAVYLILSFAISCFLLHLGVFVADLKNIITIVLRLLFYISGVFFSINHRIPAPYNEIILNVNPVAFFIDSMRNVALYKTMPNMWVLLAWTVISLFLAWWGVRLIYINENSYVKSI